MASGVIFVPTIEERYLVATSETASRMIPPLGAEWVRHVIECTFPQHKIRVVHGGDQPAESLDELMRPEDTFLGFSCTSLSYGKTLGLMEEAQQRNIPVFMGGVHARVLGRNIVKNRPGVNVITGPGENVLSSFLNGVPVDEIKGIWSTSVPRNGNDPGAPYEFHPFLHETTEYDSLFSEWGDRGNELYSDDESKMRIGVRGLMGCSKADMCSFCSAPRVKPYEVKRRAQYLMEERKSIVRQFGDLTYILDCSDSLPGKETLLEMAKYLSGGQIGTRVHCGSMVWELLDEEWRDLAWRAGYTDFLIGLEGYAQQFLPLAYKPEDSIDMVFRLLDKTRDSDIRYMISGIVGWPGETEETLQEASETVRRLLEYDSVIVVSVNCLMPLPGSPLFTDLRKTGYIDPDTDCPDMREMFKAHVKENCPELSVARLFEFTEEMRSLDDRVIQVLGFAAD